MPANGPHVVDFHLITTIMKNLFALFTALALFSFSSCEEANNSTTETEDSKPIVSQVANITPVSNTSLTMPSEDKLTTVAYEEETFDFGKMKVDDNFSHKFILKNTGTEDLMIVNVKPSCSCTASDWTKTPIAPGESGYVIAEYKPKPDYKGFFSKTVTVTTNTDPKMKVLKFTGEIVN